MFFILSGVFFLNCNPSSNTGNTNAKEDSTTIRNDSIAVDKKNTPALQPDKFRSIFEKGVDFLATGNEPFWSLEIDFDKSIHFKPLSGFEMNTPIVEGVKAADANVTRYQANTEKGVLIVQIQKMKCINDMSGEELEYRVTIDTKNNTDKDYTTYKGCGRYLSDYRLHDIWVLDSIGNKKMQTTDFTKGLPQMEFNLTEKRIFGSTGCNSINGVIEVLGKKIQFGRLATTRMACPDMSFESAYLQKLDNKTVPYQIKPGKLYLLVSPDSVFVYKKID